MKLTPLTFQDIIGIINSLFDLIDNVEEFNPIYEFFN